MPPIDRQELAATATWARVRRLGAIQLGLGVVCMLLVFHQIDDRPLRDLGVLAKIAVMAGPLVLAAAMCLSNWIVLRDIYGQGEFEPVPTIIEAPGGARAVKATIHSPLTIAIFCALAAARGARPDPRAPHAGLRLGALGTDRAFPEADI